MCKRIVNTLIILFAVLPLFGQTACEVFDRFVAKLESQTLRSSVRLTISENATQPLNYNGTVVMAGECFKVSLLSTEAAYDGKTLYVYSEDTDELTLSSPSADELQEANPLFFAKALRLKSDVRFASSGKTQCYVVELLPHHKEAGVKRLTLSVDKTTLLPQEIAVDENSQTTVLRFLDAEWTKLVSDFVVVKEGAFVNDLR